MHCTVYIEKCANNLFAIKGKVRLETRAVTRYFRFKRSSKNWNGISYVNLV
jgi:hypothetical protein